MTREHQELTYTTDLGLHLFNEKQQKVNNFFFFFLSLTSDFNSAAANKQPCSQEIFRFHFTLGMNKWVLQEEIKLSRTKVFGVVSTVPQLRYLTITPLRLDCWEDYNMPEPPLRKMQNCEYPSYFELLPSAPLNRLHTIGCTWSCVCF